MRYYEIWFYYYGADDERTDFNKEFTFYLKTDKVFDSDQQMIDYLVANFTPSDQYNVDQINCIDHKHLEHMSRWFEISAQEFVDGCGISA